MIDENKLFRRGFLLTTKEIELEDYFYLNEWNKEKIFNYYFYIHNEQEFFHIFDNNEFIFLIGHAFNPFSDEIDEKKIIKKIFENKEDVIELINELTGLFIIGLYDQENGLRLFTDCSGMLISYYGLIEGNVYISSHMQLIGDICNLEKSEYIKRLINYKYYKLYGPYLPGNLSSYDCIKRIVPNTYITYKKNEFQITRFYPNKELVMCSDEQSYEELLETIVTILEKTMLLISKKWKRPAISCTGGMDSKLTLACTNNIYDKFQYFSYVSSKAEKIDSEAAHKICDYLGLNHKIYEIEQSNENEFNEVKDILEHNFGEIGSLNTNDIKKRIYFDHTKDFDIEVKSWVSEIGRANYYKKFGKNKMPKHLSPKQMALMYKVFNYRDDLFVKTIKVFEDYIRETNFGINFYNYDDSDMFLWEIRYGGWGGLVLTSEHKYSFDITVPYNNRILIEKMLQSPLKKRITDEFHEDLIRMANKKIDEVGITVVNLNETKIRMFIEKLYFNIGTILPIK